LVRTNNAAKATPTPVEKVDMDKPDSAPTTGKIALEEHFALPENNDTGYGPPSAADYWTQ